MQEEPFTNLPALVRAASSSLGSHLDKPFALFGHSMGALVCFELARQLRRDYSVRPAHLFVSACRSPQTATDDSPDQDLSEDDLMAMLRRPDGLPNGAAEDDELIDMLLPCLRADIAICRTYVYSPGPPLDCPITAFGGLQDHKISRDSLEGWREHTALSFHLRVLPGDHYFLHTSQLLLLRSITLDLSRHTACAG